MGVSLVSQVGKFNISPLPKPLNLGALERFMENPGEDTKQPPSVLCERKVTSLACPRCKREKLLFLIVDCSRSN